MENNKIIRVAIFYSGSHLEEKSIESGDKEIYKKLIEAEIVVKVARHKLRIGDKDYVVLHNAYRDPVYSYGPDAFPSIANDYFGKIIYGNVLICNEDKNGLSSLTKDDFRNIKNHISFLMASNSVTGGKGYLFPVIRTNNINDSVLCYQA